VLVIQPRATIAQMRIDKNSKFVGIEKSCLRLRLRAAMPGAGNYFEGFLRVDRCRACIGNRLDAGPIEPHFYRFGRQAELACDLFDREAFHDLFYHDDTIFATLVLQKSLTV